MKIANSHLKMNASYKIISLLSQSKSQMEKILDDLPDIFAIVDEMGRILKGNRTLGAIFERDTEELLGLNFSTLLSGNDRVLFMPHLKSDYSQKELELTLKNRKYIFKIKSLFQPNESKGKEPLFFLLGSDVTSLRNREEELFQLSEHLQDLVEEKTQKISSLLDSIDQAIFSVYPDMRLSSAFSKKAQALFGDENPIDRKTLTELLDLDLETKNQFQDWYEIISSKRSRERWAKYAPLCPVLSLVRKDRHIVFEYKPILTNGEFSQLLVLATDVTEKLKQELALQIVEQEQKRHTERILGLIHHPLISLDIFFQESWEALSEIKKILQEVDLAARDLFLKIHTLKGNCGSFGFNHLVSIFHRMEDLIESSKKSVPVWEDWQEQVKLLLTEYEELQKWRDVVFAQASDQIWVHRKTYEDLLESMKNQQYIPEIRDLYAKTKDLDGHFFKDFCQKYNHMIHIYRSESGKNIKDLNILTPSFWISKNLMKILDPILIHLIRNAMDHGIEDPREISPKGPGEISIHCEKKDSIYEIKVQDNGRGIDPILIAKSALKKGLKTESELAQMGDAEKMHLIFLEGFSTKDEVTTISGRGVGLDVVKAMVDKEKASLQLYSEVGVGTQFILSFKI
jgi:two-component system chemotaxis sensor kinase CheA